MHDCAEKSEVFGGGIKNGVGSHRDKFVALGICRGMSMQASASPAPMDSAPAVVLPFMALIISGTTVGDD